MKTMLIKSSNDDAAKLVARFARKMKMQVRLLSDKEWEDIHLASLIDRGMEEKGEVPLERVRKKLRT